MMAVQILGACLAIIVTAGSSGFIEDLPESGRSRRVIQRMRPSLEKRCIEQGVSLGDPLYIRIFKSEKELEIWLRNDSGYSLVETLPVAYFSGDLGPKTRQGDNQAPEGFYWVVPRRMNPWSRYHLSFDLGYPNARDRQHGCTGGLIMVHGSTVSIGCFAMTDPGIERIYTYAHEAFVNGQRFFRVHVFPFRMTDANMAMHSGSPHDTFWKNLKKGYDFFECRGVEPDVNTNDGQYTFRVPSGLVHLYSDDPCQNDGADL